MAKNDRRFQSPPSTTPSRRAPDCGGRPRPPVGGRHYLRADGSRIPFSIGGVRFVSPSGSCDREGWTVVDDAMDRPLGRNAAWYFVLCFGCTLDFIPRSCSFGRQDSKNIARACEGSIIRAPTPHSGSTFSQLREIRSAPSPTRAPLAAIHERFGNDTRATL